MLPWADVAAAMRRYLVTILDGDGSMPFSFVMFFRDVERHCIPLPYYYRHQDCTHANCDTFLLLF